MAEFAEVLRSKGYATELTDLSASNVANAGARGFTAHRIDLNEGLPGLEDDAYDVVGMLEIIEHVVASERLLAEAGRVLRPGGLLVLSTPNYGFVQERLQTLAGRPPIAEGYHYRFFTIRSMREQLARAGLRVVEERFSSPAIGANVVRRRLLRKTGRKHVMIPRGLAPALAQTMYFLARKPLS
jgi:2-polyprenyl-3-methyl-5-hydroxy-6-metoxy-1,4-benzoquinol methylase